MLITKAANLLRPSRRSFIMGAAGILAAPAVVRAAGWLPLVSSTALTTPATIFGTDLLIWLKPDAGLTAPGGNVTAWVDQANSVSFAPGNNLGSVPCNSPVYSATGFPGSKPCVQFTNAGSTGLITGTSASSFGASNKNMSVFAVLQSASVSNAAPVIAFLGTGNTDEISGAGSVSIRQLSGQSIQTVHASGGFNNDTFSLSTKYRMSWVFDGTNETSYFSNVQQNQTAASWNWGDASGNGGWGIGFYLSGGANYATFDLAELVIVKRAATTGDRSSMDSYFAGRGL